MALHGLSRTRARALLTAVLLLWMAGGGSAALGASPPRSPTPTARTAADPGPGVELAQTQAAIRDTQGGVHWKPCGIDAPGYDCALVTVPLDYDRPARGTTQVALARLPATATTDRVGSVFVNPGGPGGSGLGLVFSRFGQFLSTRLHGRFDIVGFDPRGVAASDPLHCFGSGRKLENFVFSQPVFPYRQGQYRSYFHALAGLGRECHDDRQRVVRHMSTADVARDLDRLRQLVGDQRITYLGFSYGSYLGNTYANLFPDRIRALVIDGVLDPRLWASGHQIESDRVATRKEFAEFLRLCDEAGPECPFWTSAGPSSRRWERLTSTIRRHPLNLGGGEQYTYDFLIADAVNAMYAPEVWDGPNGAAALFNFVADAVLAGKASAADDVARLHKSLSSQLRPREADYPNGLDAYYGNQCADTQYPRAFRVWRATDRHARVGSRFGPFWWWGNTGCAHWPVNADRYAGPWTAQTSAPVLVVGNYFDGITDYDGAMATAHLLPNSRLLSYAGWGHTAYHRSGCVTDYVNTYLLTESLPPEGQVCPANPNPFLQRVGARETPRTRPLVGLPGPWLLARH